MAINLKNGDKSVIKSKIGDKKSTKFKKKIVEYLAEHEEVRSQEISAYIGLKISRTKIYLSELVEEGKITPNGANKNRTYSLKKKLLLLPHLPAGNNHQQCASGYAANFLEIAPELPPLCLALLAKFFGVFGLVAAALFAFVPEFLGHCVSP